MIPKVIKISCAIGIVAFLFHATLAPFYETGGFRFTASIVFIGIAILLFSFLRRQQWSWLLVLIFTAVNVITSIFFPPSEKFYGSLTLTTQILVSIESLACLVIFMSMLFPATRVWFTGFEVIRNTNLDEFHKGEVLEVTYRYNFWDIVWFNFYQTPRSRVVQISFVVIILVSLFIIFSSLSDTEYSFGVKVLTFAFIMTLIFIGLIVFSFIALGFIYIVRRFDYRLSVSEGGVISEVLSKNRGIKWSEIKKIQQNSSYKWLFISEIEAILVPKRAFTNKPDIDKFFDYSYSCFEMSKKENLLK